MPASWRPMLSVVTSVLWPAEVVRIGRPAFGKACPAMRTETPRAAIAPKLQTLFLFMARAPLLLIGLHEDIEGPDRLFPPLRRGRLAPDHAALLHVVEVEPVVTYEEVVAGLPPGGRPGRGG